MKTIALAFALAGTLYGAENPPVIINEPVTVTVAAGQAWSHVVLATVVGSTVTAAVSDAPGGLAKPSWVSVATPTISGTTSQVTLSGTPTTAGVARFRLTITAGTTGSTAQDITLIVQASNG